MFRLFAPSLARASSARMRAALAVLLVGVAVAAAGTTLPASGATSTVVVTATVPSATQLSTTGCASEVAGKTAFGAVLPGATNVTTADCAVTFGSGNDTARLRMFQSDDGGNAMWRGSLGAIDATVGSGTGFTTQNIIGDTSWYDVLYAPSINRYYATGYGSGSGALVARYMPDGTLDTSWAGGAGWIRPVIGAGTTDVGYDLALGDDGSLYVTGRTFGIGSGDYVGMFKLTPAGALDTTFGGGTGKVAYALNDNMVVGRIALTADGHILLCGTGGGIGADNGLWLARLSATGALDTTFGSGDSTPSDGFLFPAQHANSLDCGGILEDPNGKIVVAGRNNNSSAWGMAAWRLNADGTPDTTFNGTGFVKVLSSDDYASVSSIQLDDDGRLVMAGQFKLGSNLRGMVVRLTPSGVPDPSFGAGNGRLEFQVPGGTASWIDEAVTIGDDATYVSGGNTNGDVDGYIAKVTEAGALDPTFGTGGTVTFDTQSGRPDELTGIALGRDGRIVAVGSVDPSAGNDKGSFAAITATTIPDYGAGATWGGAGQAAFGACLHAIGGGATATGWTQDPACAATDGADWQAVPHDGASGSVAITPSTTVNATVGMRFGLRTLSGQSPGSYLAPITFEVVAPG